MSESTILVPLPVRFKLSRAKANKIALDLSPRVFNAAAKLAM